MGRASQCCKRNNLQHESNCLNLFKLCSPNCRSSIASRAFLELVDPSVGPVEGITCVPAMLCKARVWVLPLDWTPVFFELCSKNANCVGSSTPPTLNPIDRLASLRRLGEVLNVNQDGPQWRVGLVGNLFWRGL